MAGISAETLAKLGGADVLSDSVLADAKYMMENGLGLYATEPSVRKPPRGKVAMGQVNTAADDVQRLMETGQRECYGGTK